MSTDKKIPDDYSVEPDDTDDAYARELKLEPTTAAPDEKSDEPRPKTFHSRRAVAVEEPAPRRKRRFTHAETSGLAISAVMLVYSFATADKPLFFVSLSLLTFLLRPLIGALFGKHSRAVQNGLYTFSVVLFVGALIMLFAGS